MTKRRSHTFDQRTIYQLHILGITNSSETSSNNAVPSLTDNRHTSLVIAFSYYLHRNFLTILQFSSNELLHQRQYMSKRI